MPKVRRSSETLEGDLEARSLAATLGAEVRRTRHRRRMTQRSLAERIGWHHARISELERGEGATAPLAAWMRIGKVLGRPLAVTLSRDIEPPGPADAGHLSGQEVVLRLARASGRIGLFELPTRPADPSRSIDVGLRDDRHRQLILVEIWNRLDDLGAAARSTSRKLAEADVVAGFNDRGYRVANCWLLVDTAANRNLVRRYPEVLRSRFVGSSVAWARALTYGGPVPLEPGLCWIDTRSGRIRPLRLR